MVRGLSGERRDYLVVIGGDGGRDEGGESGGRGRGEGGPHQLDGDWDGDLEGEEGGDGGRLLSGGLGESFFQIGRERKEGVIGGLRVNSGLLSKKGVQSQNRGGDGDCGGGEEAE